MKDNEKIVHIFEIKGNIDLAKVQIVTELGNGVQHYRTSFESKRNLPAQLVRHYFDRIKHEPVNPQIEQIEGEFGTGETLGHLKPCKPHVTAKTHKPLHGGYPGKLPAPKLRFVYLLDV